MPEHQVVAITKVQSNIKTMFELVEELNSEIGVDSFDALKNLLRETLNKIKNCNATQEKVFAFVETILDFQPNTVPASPPSQV